MEIDQAEWDKRVSICQRKYLNFVSRMILDFGLMPVPMIEVTTIEGVLHIPGKNQFLKASDGDLEQAAKNIEEANKRYKERKARAPKKEEPKVADLIGENK